MEIFVIVNNFSRVFFNVFPHVKVIDRQSAYDIGKMTMILNVYMTYSMYKMAIAGVPSGTILAVLTEMFAFIKRNKSDATFFA